MIPSEEIIQTLLEHPKQQDALKHLGMTRSALHKRAKTNSSIAKVLESLRSDRKNAKLNVPVSQSLKKRLQEKADTKGILLSEYVREVLEFATKES